VDYRSSTLQGAPQLAIRGWNVASGILAVKKVK
jgi:hypothetical protein